MLWTGLQNIFNHSGCECQNLMWIGLQMSESTLINYIRKMNSLSLLKENTLKMFGFLWDFYIYGSIMWLKELCGTMTNILSISFVSNTQGPICDAFYFLRIQNSSCLLPFNVLWQPFPFSSHSKCNNFFSQTPACTWS